MNTTILAKTQELIAIPSTADNIPALHAAVDTIVAILEPHKHITIERFERAGIPSILAYKGPIRPAQFTILLSAHVDVVPAQTAAQYTPYIANSRLYGRGAYDMKTAAVVMAQAFIDASRQTDRAIGLQITADEETNGTHGVAYQLEQGIKADFTIFGEMTNLDICNELRGLCWIEVAFSGASAHGAYVWRGDNALNKASAFAVNVLKEFPVPAQEEWCTTANIAAISTENNTYNIVPKAATVKVDFRFTPQDERFRDTTTVAELVKSIDPQARITEFKVFGAAVKVDDANPYLQELQNAYTQTTGKHAKLVRHYGSGDSRYFAAAGMDSVEFGIAGEHPHHESENVDLASLEPYYKTLMQFLTHPPKA